MKKFRNETKTNLIPKNKPKTKNWNLPIIEKYDLVKSRNQKGPYIEHHDDDYLRLLNDIKSAEPKFQNIKNDDIICDEKTKTTYSLLKETQNLDPEIHKMKMWKTHNNKLNSVTPDIRGNKGLFAYTGSLNQ